MQIPTLIETAGERMLYVIVTQLPGAMNYQAILVNLILRKRYTLRRAMRPDRHDVRRAIRQPDTGAGKRNLHHVLREIARGMHHVLMRGGDAATRRVIISAEVRRGATTPSCPQEQREVDPAIAPDDR